VARSIYWRGSASRPPLSGQGGRRVATGSAGRRPFERPADRQRRLSTGALAGDRVSVTGIVPKRGGRTENSSVASVATSRATGYVLARELEPLARDDNGRPPASEASRPRCRAREEMLEVVEQINRPAESTSIRFSSSSRPRCRNAERRRTEEHEVGSAPTRRYPPHTVGEGFHASATAAREACLADSARGLCRRRTPGRGRAELAQLVSTASRRSLLEGSSKEALRRGNSPLPS
jgi:hypothetical protein